MTQAVPIRLVRGPLKPTDRIFNSTNSNDSPVTLHDSPLPKQSHPLEKTQPCMRPSIKHAKRIPFKRHSEPHIKYAFTKFGFPYRAERELFYH